MAEGQKLDPIAAEESSVTSTVETLQTVMAELNSELDVIAEKFEPYLDLVTMEPQVHVEAFLATKPTTKDIHAELMRLYELTHGVESALEDSERFRMYTVKCDTVKKTCAARARLATKCLLEKLRETMEAANEDIRQRTAVIKETTEQVSDKCEETFELEAYSKRIEGELESLQEEIGASQEQMDALNDFQFELSGPELTDFWTTVGCPADITRMLEAASGRIADEKRDFLEQLEKDKMKLVADMDGYGDQIIAFEKCGPESDVDEVADGITSLQDLMAECKERIEVINSREELYAGDPTDYLGTSR